MNKILLIGGAPTAGKSYTARKIAEELKLPWISTDTIRGQMRKIVEEDRFPKLFVHSEATAEMAVEFLSSKSAHEIVQTEVAESKDVWEGVKSLIETDYVWGDFIIEGVAILPELVKNLSLKRKELKVVFIVDDDVERIRETVYTRGLWDDADKYPDSVKEKEIEWVLEFNKYIITEAEKYGFPVIKIGDRKDYIEQIKSLF